MSDAIDNTTSNPQQDGPGLSKLEYLLLVVIFIQLYIWTRWVSEYIETYFGWQWPSELMETHWPYWVPLVVVIIAMAFIGWREDQRHKNVVTKNA